MINNEQLKPFVLAHIGEVCFEIGQTSQDIDENRIHPDRNMGSIAAGEGRVEYLTPLMEQQLQYLQGILAILYPEKAAAAKIVKLAIEGGLVKVGPDGKIQ
jgi:hypothetical protein